MLPPFLECTDRTRLVNKRRHRLGQKDFVHALAALSRGRLDVKATGKLGRGPLEREHVAVGLAPFTLADFCAVKLRFLRDLLAEMDVQVALGGPGTEGGGEFFGDVDNRA